METWRERGDARARARDLHVPPSSALRPRTSKPLALAHATRRRRERPQSSQESPRKHIGFGPGLNSGLGRDGKLRVITWEPGDSLSEYVETM